MVAIAEKPLSVVLTEPKPPHELLQLHTSPLEAQSTREWRRGERAQFAKKLLEEGKTVQEIVEAGIPMHLLANMRSRNIDIPRIKMSKKEIKEIVQGLQDDDLVTRKTALQRVTWTIYLRGRNSFLTAVRTVATSEGLIYYGEGSRAVINSLKMSAVAPKEIQHPTSRDTYSVFPTKDKEAVEFALKIDPSLDQLAQTPSIKADRKLYRENLEIDWETYLRLTSLGTVLSVPQVAIRAGTIPKNTEDVYKIVNKLRKAGITVGRVPTKSDPTEDLILFVPRWYLDQAIQSLKITQNRPWNGVWVELYSAQSNRGSLNGHSTTQLHKPENHQVSLQARAEQVLQELSETHHKSIYNYICIMMGDPEVAQDFTQETFLRAWRALPAILSSGRPLQARAWLYRIATNICKDELRHRKLVKWQPWEAFISTFHPSQVARDNPERDALEKENREEVQLILDRLHPKYRTVIILREYQDLSYKEIAEVLNTTFKAAKSMLYRAREEFRQVYARSERQPAPVAR